MITLLPKLIECRQMPAASTGPLSRWQITTSFQCGGYTLDAASKVRTDFRIFDWGSISASTSLLLSSKSGWLDTRLTVQQLTDRVQPQGEPQRGALWYGQ